MVGGSETGASVDGVAVGAGTGAVVVVAAVGAGEGAIVGLPDTGAVVGLGTGAAVDAAAVGAGTGAVVGLGVLAGRLLSCTSCIIRSQKALSSSLTPSFDGLFTAPDRCRRPPPWPSGLAAFPLVPVASFALTKARNPARIARLIRFMVKFQILFLYFVVSLIACLSIEKVRCANIGDFCFQRCPIS